MNLEVLVSIQMNFTKIMSKKKKVAKECIENDIVSVLLSDTWMMEKYEVIHEGD